ncbi:MAG: amidohydrolase family protein [Acidobacteriota bacterium]
MGASWLLAGPVPVAGPGVRVINLGGKTVVPGLIEPHVHIVSLGNRPGYHTILENTTSIREVQEALAARRKEAPDGAWITSMGGWHPNQWAEHRHPTLKELDDAVPDRPVFLYERFTGPCAVNSLAKAYFDGMDAAAPVHPDVKKVNVIGGGRDCGRGVCWRRSIGDGAVLLAAIANVRGSQAKHGGCDAIFGQRGADDALGSSVVPDAGAAESVANLVESGPVSDVRSVAGAAPRGQSDQSAADEFLAEPGRSCAAGVERALAEPVPVFWR